LTEIQDGVKSAIWHFFETLKNAYRTGAEINGIIESAAQTLKAKLMRLFKGQMILLVNSKERF
jgi:phosphoribosyl-dephospho-CoA transferase